MNTSALVKTATRQTLTSFIGTLTLPAALPASAVTANYANGAAVNPNQSVITEQVWFRAQEDHESDRRIPLVNGLVPAAIR